LLTLLGIAIGIATAVASHLTIHAAHNAYRDLFAGVNGQPALEVVAPGAAGFDPAVADGLKALPGVRAVVPRVQAVTTVVFPAGAVPVLVLGTDVDSPSALASFPLATGRPCRGEDEVLLGRGFARAQGLKPGQSVRLWTPAGPAELRCTGSLEPQGVAAANGGAVAVVPLTTAQRLFELPGQVNNVQVILEAGADADRVGAAVSARLPPGLTAQRPGRRGELARSTLLAAEQGLAALGVVALVGAAFVILNTVLLSVGQRRSQLATLRALGATRAQVRGLLLREALAVGMAGTALGYAAGLALAAGLTHVLGRFLGVPLPAVAPTAGSFLLAATLGPVTTLAAACLPAWRASRQGPLGPMRDRAEGRDEGLPPGASAAGLALLALAGVLHAGLCRDWWAPAWRGNLLAAVVALFLLGCVLALPPLVGLTLRAFALLPRRALGVAGTLALRTLRGKRTRTGLTAGVLFIAVAVAVAFGHALASTLRDLRQWYGHTILADFLVRGSMPDSGFALAAGLPETLGEELAHHDGVAAVDRLAFVPIRLAVTSGVRSPQSEVDAGLAEALVLARTFTPGQPLPLDLREGTEAEVRAGLARGEVVLGTGLARDLGLHRGDTLAIEALRGTVFRRVAGTANEYAVGGKALTMAWEAAREVFGSGGVHVFLVSARPGAAAALAPRLRRFCDRQRLLLQSNGELHGHIDRLLARVTGLLRVLLALAFVVAALGVANTLTMTVREQARDLAVLRALGMGRGQVGRVVLWQALLTGLAGVLPGAAGGVGLAWLIHRAGVGLPGPDAAFRVNGGLVGGCCLLALLVGLAAALLPARRAARTRVVRALHQL
jgi:putative ABC transport system permease protein